MLGHVNAGGALSGRLSGVNRQQEALSLAEALVADVELSRLGAPQLLLKAGRLARLVEDDDARTWITWELEGYPNTQAARVWLARAGRVQSAEKIYFVPLSRITALADSHEQRIQAASGTSVSGEWALVVTNNRPRPSGWSRMKWGPCAPSRAPLSR